MEDALHDDNEDESEPVPGSLCVDCELVDCELSANFFNDSKYMISFWSGSLELLRE